MDELPDPVPVPPGRRGGGRLELTGSLAAPWPVPGCHCPTCLGPTPSTLGWLGRTGLRAGPLLIEDDAVRDDATGAPRRLGPGEVTEAAGVRVVAFPAASPDEPCPLVVGAGGRTVLWAPGCTGLAEVAEQALTGAGLDGAVFGVRTVPGGGPVRSLAHRVALLRRIGAVRADADLVAVGWDHEVAPADAWSGAVALLAEWGVRLCPDGGPLAEQPAPAAVPPRRTLVLGPAASGKSQLAEDLLAAEPAVLYAATGPAPDPAADPGWARRVRRHRERRPAHWATAEQPDLAELLREPGPPLLVDSLGTWVTGVLDRCGGWQEEPGWRERWDAEAAAVLAGWRQAARTVVAVAEETGWGVHPASAAGARFRDLLGDVTRQLAAGTERRLLVVAGAGVELPGPGPRWAPRPDAPGMIPG